MKYLLIAFAAIGFAACSGKSDKNETATIIDKMPKMDFGKDSTAYDFGELKEGQIVEHQFKFTNTGEFPLIINDVRASCGCTIPEWPKEPIKPGTSDKILVRFNTKGKAGPQSKTVTITANTNPSYTTIQFSAVVLRQKDSTGVGQ
jgi:Protein of unknown function (DUF1573)